MKYLLWMLPLFILACANPSKEEGETELWEFHPQNHQSTWDQQAFLIVNEYQVIQQNLNINDTNSYKMAIQNLMAITDTIVAHTVETDSLTQNIWLTGLQNYRNELEALVLEQDPMQVQQQFNMCTVSLIHFLGDIGYSKTNLYIFQKVEGEDGWFWIGTSKSSKNPFDKTDRKDYNASFTLQDPS